LPKNWTKNCRFWIKFNLIGRKKDHSICFQENAHFSAKNWWKWSKICSDYNIASPVLHFLNYYISFVSGANLLIPTYLRSNQIIISMYLDGLGSFSTYVCITM
jgi:hypothetical protein